MLNETLESQRSQAMEGNTFVWRMDAIDVNPTLNKTCSLNCPPTPHL